MAGFFFTNTADDPAPTSPDAIAQKRKLAQALMQQGMDFSPIRSPWQGAARVAQGVLGALDYRDADKQDAAGMAQAQAQVNALTGGFSGAPAAPAAPAAAGPATFTPGFDGAVTRTLGFEGGLNPKDTNGTPSNMGINQKANPDLDVNSLTPDAAKGIYKTRYWDAINGDQLNSQNPGLARVAFDTAVIAGPQKAQGMLAQSGGDPNKFMALREAFLNGLVQKDPSKYGPYQKAWAARNAGLRSDIGAPIQNAAVQTDTEEGDDAAPAKAAVSSALSGAPAAGNPFAAKLPAAMAVLNNPYATSGQKMIAQAILQKGMTNPEQYNTFKDADGNLFQKNSSTGQMQLVMKASDNQKDPEASRKLNDALSNWEKYKLPDPNDPSNSAFWRDFSAKTLGGAGQQISTTVNSAVNPILKGLGDQFTTQRETADAAANTVRAVHSARQQLDEGIIAGAGADTRLALQKLGSLMGVSDPSKITSTETFRTQIKPIVLETVKGLGAGSGISNADRDFALQAVGGDINLDESTIRRVLDITERASRSKIDRFNKVSDSMLETQPELKQAAPMMRVTQPDEYSFAKPAQAAPAGGPSVGEIRKGYRFKGGNPGDPKSWEAVQKGPAT